MPFFRRKREISDEERREAEVRRVAFNEVTAGNPARQAAFSGFQRWLSTVPVDQVDIAAGVANGFLVAIVEARVAGELPPELTKGQEQEQLAELTTALTGRAGDVFEGAFDPNRLSEDVRRSLDAMLAAILGAQFGVEPSDNGRG